MNSAPALNREWIAAHIPHQGAMCLLDEVLEWNAHAIRCRSGTHRAADHALRSARGLGIACGIEYAAQAMALHGALASRSHIGTGPRKAAMGLLASVRAVRFHAVRLDDIQADLICEAQQLAGDEMTAMYEFSLHADGRALLDGRASVVFDAARRRSR
jgi:predicted hotdog family 3-hydroxylacyl-ACP dehydratase